MKNCITTSAFFILILSLSLPLFADPRITVYPLLIESDLFTGEVRDYNIEIGNEGDEQLQFEIEIEYLGHDEGWLEVEPLEAQIDPNEEMALAVTYIWPGEYWTDYHADIIIHSNDPENGEVIIEVRLDDLFTFVNTEWSEDFGFPDEINWNSGNDNLYTGQEYETTLSLIGDYEDDARIVVQLSTDNEFFSIDPEQIDMDPDDQVEITLTLNAEQDGLHEAELMIYSRLHFQEEMSIPHIKYIPLIAETVTPPFEIALDRGWNMISSPLDPEDRDIRSIFSDLMEEGSLLMVKDYSGRFYMPRFNYCNIPFWNPREVYLVKTTETGTLTITGEEMAVDTRFDLREGWNGVAYIPPAEIGAVEAFRAILASLVIGKNGQGNFIAPDWDYNNLPPLRRGSGYAVNVNRNIQFIWSVPDDERR